MRRTFILSKNISDQLALLAKEQNTTMTSIVETALTIYFLMNAGDPEQSSLINKQVQRAQEEQLSIWDMVGVPKRKG